MTGHSQYNKYAKAWPAAVLALLFAVYATPAAFAQDVTAQPLSPVQGATPSVGERDDGDQSTPADQTTQDQAEPTAPASPPTLRWRVENPFRFFKSSRDTALHIDVFDSLSPEQRLTPILAAERILNSVGHSGWAASTYRRTCWNWARNRHQCGNGKDYINPKSHAVVIGLQGQIEPGVQCRWITSPERGAKVTGRIRVLPCDEPVRAKVPYPGGLRVTLEIGGQQIAREVIKVRDVLVAGMGDSFASGEGNPDVPVRFSPERAVDYGTATESYDLTGYPARAGKWTTVGDQKFIDQNARWLDQACHRSLYSHQLRTALQLAIDDPHRAVTFVGVSCSGAEVTYGLFRRYKGNEWVPNPPDLSQISALAAEQCGSNRATAVDVPEAYHMRGAIRELQGGLVLRKCDRKQARKIDLLLVSIGGNDIGFARLVATAVLADQSLLKKLGGWFGQLNEALKTRALLKNLNNRYKSLNRAAHAMLHIPWQESDRVILTAYPPLALLGENLQVCPDGPAGMDVMSDFSLSQKRALNGMLLAGKLDDVMRKSARRYGWSYVDAHRKAFVGRGICSGFTDGTSSLGDDLRLPRLVEGNWVPYSPAEYRPYISRLRWFRTPNDAFLTGNFHVTGSVLQKALKLESLSWFQVLLASTYSGAFHPTAEGQAAIADAVLQKARSVLKKYGQASNANQVP
jgi:lysophospholipase L1-like esterase